MQTANAMAAQLFYSIGTGQCGSECIVRDIAAFQTHRASHRRARWEKDAMQNNKKKQNHAMADSE
eukprot:3757006-Rhodomonas_salina.3